jgi:hypothetical protein
MRIQRKFAKHARRAVEKLFQPNSAELLVDSPIANHCRGGDIEHARQALQMASSRGETILPHGAAAGNAIGLTTQVPMREIYLTSGRSRCLQLGAQTVEIWHAPAWQLLFPGRVAGDVLRALA